MHANVSIRAQGRFKLIKHTGHKFDENGNVLEWGRVLEETPLSDNIFTYYGSLFLLGRASNTISLTVSDSASAPTLLGPGPTVGPVFTRTSTALVETFTERTIEPDADGNLIWRKRYRYNFPAYVGGPVVDVRQCFATASGGSVAGFTSGPISVSKLTGPTGDEFPIRVNMTQEDFDVVWEYTEYVPFETVHTLVGRVQDGSNIVLSETTYTCTVRPANFLNVDVALQGWAVIEGPGFPGTSLTFDYLYIVGLGEIAFADGEATFTEFFNPIPSSIVLDGLTALGQTSNALTVLLDFLDTTSTEQIDCAQFWLGHTEWQISFEPPIPKQERHRLRLRLSLSVVNR